ncbi:hypothetical protein B0T20DRAFT_99191 [Sordaria brevicollis]|uniref:Uncharacterized protein n=1 Tax=Sordaria brevicollis TaxID=83679 RepID=A0AAE0U2Y5_SORBR|nr:hypothetical protein B0T20DRAFT_99191 [Sordaria brevicollis]
MALVLLTLVGLGALDYSQAQQPSSPKPRTSSPLSTCQCAAPDNHDDYKGLPTGTIITISILVPVAHFLIGFLLLRTSVILSTGQATFGNSLPRPFSEPGNEITDYMYLTPGQLKSLVTNMLIFLFTWEFFYLIRLVRGLRHVDRGLRHFDKIASIRRPRESAGAGIPGYPDAPPPAYRRRL